MAAHMWNCHAKKIDIFNLQQHGKRVPTHVSLTPNH
jgi:hypothetical protein